MPLTFRHRPLSFINYKYHIRNNMSQLIGTASKINVACKANIEENGKKLSVSFIAVFSRLTRQNHKDLQKRLSDMIRQVRAFAPDAIKLDETTVAIDSDGKLTTDLNDIRDNDLNILSAAEKEEKRKAIESEIEALNSTVDKEIKDHLHDIQKLEDEQGKTIAYSDELVDEMLTFEPYFVALRDGLYKATGTYSEQKRKN